MKSENRVIITGVIASDPVANPSKTHYRFRLVHNFGGGRRPLILDWVLIKKTGLDIPHKGVLVRVSAYLRMHADRIEAVVKTINTQP